MKPQQQELQKRYTEYQMTQQQFKYINDQLKVIEKQVQELTIAQESVNEIIKQNKDTDTLVHIGAGIFTKAKYVPDKEFTVNVGADCAVTKSHEDTLKLLNSQLEELTKAHQQLTQNSDHVKSRLLELQQSLSSSRR